MTQFPTYHDPFTANIPPDVVAAIEEQCGMPFEEAVEKYGGQPILCDDGSYVAIADPPGCGRTLPRRPRRTGYCPTGKRAPAWSPTLGRRSASMPRP